MSKCVYRQIGNVNTSKNVKYRLKVTDYIFNYLGQDLTNAYLEYYFDDLKYVKYENGKREKEGKAPIIFFSISANLYNNEYSFEFCLEKSLDDLNKLKINTPKDITKFINEGETYFQGPDNFESIYFPSKNNLYGYDPVFKVTKFKKNKFLFKIQCQNIFLWFIAIFE